MLMLAEPVHATYSKKKIENEGLHLVVLWIVETFACVICPNHFNECCIYKWIVEEPEKGEHFDER